MKLHYNVASPYVRKVMAVAIETGLRDRLELAERKMSPVKPERRAQPGQPARQDPLPGDRRRPGALQFPGGLRIPRRPARWAQDVPGGRAGALAALRRQAEGDGILDAGVGTRYETFLRPEERRWPEWVQGQKAKIGRALDALDGEAASFGETVDIGTITIGCALGYLDFRYAADDWRRGRPKLAAWYDPFARRPSMAETAPAEIW